MMIKIAVVLLGAAVHMKYFCNNRCEVEILCDKPLGGAFDAVIVLESPWSKATKKLDKIEIEC